MKSSVSEAELNAYLDGQLTREQAGRLEDFLTDDPEARSTLTAMAEHKQLLRKVIAALPDGETPPKAPHSKHVRDLHKPGSGAAATQSLATKVRRLLATLDRLPDRQREALVLMALGDMRYDDAAQVLDVPPEAFLSHVVLGRKALLQTLDSTDRGNSVKLPGVEGDLPADGADEEVRPVRDEHEREHESLTAG